MLGRYRRATALAGLVGLIMSATTGIGLAAAHPGEGDEHTDVEHAKEDLADQPITQIEKETRANAAKIKEATGTTPGRRTEDQNVFNAKVSAATAQDPVQVDCRLPYPGERTALRPTRR